MQSQEVAAGICGLIAVTASGYVSLSVAFEFAVGALIVWRLWVGVGYVLQSGLFFTPSCMQGEFRGGVYLFKAFVGPYRESAKECTKVIDAAKKAKLSRWSTVCIYLDNPQKVPESECRYTVGALLKKSDKSAETVYKNEGYALRSLPTVPAGITEHPFHGVLSVLLASRKVYPMLTTFSIEQGLKEEELGPFLEECVFTKDQTSWSRLRYYAPLQQNPEFRLVT